MKHYIALIFLITIVCCCNSNKKHELTIAAAANVQPVMEQLKKEFEGETGIVISIVPGSSGKLTAQIKEGAPYDVFISADMKYPEELHAQGAAANKPAAYAQGKLVLWTMNTNITPDSTLNILLSDSIKKIAIANPETAPYGAAAVEALKHYGIYDKVKDKLVYGESISQTNQYIFTNAADIGITARSAVFSDKTKGKGSWCGIGSSYKPIEQGAVILKHGYDNDKEACDRFYQFLYSDKAKKIFSEYGYN